MRLDYVKVDNLSPLLFSIYLNDFELFYQNITMGSHLNVSMKMTVHLQLYTLLYADDTIIMAESEQDLQTALDAVFSFCKLWLSGIEHLQGLK